MENNKILFISPLQSRSGYGEHARELAEVLINYDTDFYCTGWGSNPETSYLSDNPTIFKKVVNNIENSKYDVCIHLGMPNEFKPIGKYNIGITAGVETDVCPQSFIHGYNKMDLIIVPSSFTKNTITNSQYILSDGNKLECYTDIEVIPEYSSSEFFEPTLNNTKISNLLETIKEDFCFLFTGQWVSSSTDDGGRKNVSSLIKTFCSTFNKNENIALILKTNGPDFSISDRADITYRIEEICNEYKNPPSIYLVHGELSLQEMSCLFNHTKVKCHISHTRGEGFGRPLLEASFTGKPIIAPKWSGHLDFLNKKNSLLIPGKLNKVGVVNQYFCEDAMWFDVDESKSSEYMKEVYTNYEKHLMKAKKLQTQNVGSFSKETINKLYKSILQKSIPPKITNVEFKLPSLS